VAILPVFTFAKSLTNLNGIEISEEEYNNFSKIHTYEYIMTMDEAKYEKLSTLDYTNVVSKTKFIETTYNPRLGLTTERELTEEEYDNYENTRTNLNGNCSYETAAKKLFFVVIGGNSYNYASLTATWKYIPTTRSYDVIGLRGVGFDFRDGSQNGTQIYVLNGNYNMISYHWNGSNTNTFNNGAGISMNIVNSSISALQLEIESDIQDTVLNPIIFASYQHATSNLSLANSMNYTLGNGLGNVFVYPSNISSHYDGMGGVYLSF
jgi:hypothetical protein